MPNVDITIRTKLQDKGLKAFQKSVGGLKSGALNALKGSLVGIGAAAATGFAVAAKEGLEFADATNTAMSKLQATTGATAEEMETLEENTLNVFGAGFGADIEEVAEAMAEVSKQTGLTGKALENTTKKGLAFQKKFGLGVNETTDAANTLMKRFGLTSDQAFDFIAKGLQEGLDSSGDFTDSIREYSSIFADAGFDADNFFSLMETGLQGGVLGTDKISDAIKEMNVRLNEGGTAVEEAFGALGLDFGQISASVAAGDELWAEYFDSIIAGINKIDNPIERSQAQIAIFGTMAEDLGVSFTEGLSAGVTTLEDLAGAADKVATTGAGIGEQWDIAMRQLLVGLQPVAEIFLPMLSEGIATFGEFLVEARPVFEAFARNLAETMGPAMLLIEDAALRIAKVFGLATDKTTGMDLALKALEKGLGVIVSGLQAVAIIAQGLAFAIETTDRAVRKLARSFRELKQVSQAGGLFGGGAGFAGGAIPGFQEGGTVPGAFGTPQLAVVHAGETVTPAGQTAISLNTTINASGGIDEERINALFQDFVDNTLTPALS
jgi:TP901 family phage tail tape measure protein